MTVEISWPSKPSNRAVLALAVLLVTVLFSYAVGSAFTGGGFAMKSTLPPSDLESSYQEMRSEAASVATSAAVKESAQAASGLSSPWSWVASLTDGGAEESVVDIAAEFAQRMVVFMAEIELEVADVNSALDEIQSLTEACGGFIAKVSTREGVGAMTIRVPQLSFLDVISEVEALGEVQQRDVKGEDVTEDYVDLGARLSNLEMQEERLVEILGMCTSVEEVLKVEAELERVRGSIEGVTGQIQYLESRVELATITALLREPAERQARLLPQVDWGGPMSAGLQALTTILQGLLTIVVALGPFVAIGAATLYVYRRFYGAKKGKPA